MSVKEKIVHLYSVEGFGAREAFRSLGFPSYISESNIPKDCIKDWRRIISEQGLIGLKEGKKGRKKKEKSGEGENIPESETIEYLKAKIAYLEAENEVFRLIRAGKYK